MVVRQKAFAYSACTTACLRTPFTRGYFAGMAYLRLAAASATASAVMFTMRRTVADGVRM